MGRLENSHQVGAHALAQPVSTAQVPKRRLCSAHLRHTGLELAVGWRLELVVNVFIRTWWCLLWWRSCHRRCAGQCASGRRRWGSLDRPAEWEQASPPPFQPRPSSSMDDWWCRRGSPARLDHAPASYQSCCNTSTTAQLGCAATCSWPRMYPVCASFLPYTW